VVFVGDFSRLVKVNDVRLVVLVVNSGAAVLPSTALPACAARPGGPHSALQPLRLLQEGGEKAFSRLLLGVALFVIVIFNCDRFDKVLTEVTILLLLFLVLVVRHVPLINVLHSHTSALPARVTLLGLSILHVLVFTAGRAWRGLHVLLDVLGVVGDGAVGWRRVVHLVTHLQTTTTRCPIISQANFTRFYLYMK
jgi:hypothetical protein